MQRNALFLFVSALFLFGVSVGVLLTRPAAAQATFYAYPGFPRQSDMWSYSANSSDWYVDPNTGQSFWKLVIAPDSKDRLPVLVAIHGYYEIKVYQSGQYRDWTHGATTNIGLGTGYDSGQLNQSPGVLLQPGEYFIRVPDGVNSSFRYLLLSGFWAKP